MPILSITRGHIRFCHTDGRTATVGAEGLVPMPGQPDFVIYRGSLQRWDPPHEAVAISDHEREAIMADLMDSLRTRGITFEVE